MVSNVFLYKNLRFIRIFNPDLRQYRVKSALFTSRNPDFSALPRCCVLQVHALWERFNSFQMQNKRAHDHQRTFTTGVGTEPD